MSRVTGNLLCKIPGAFRKKIYINKGDFVLVSVREYQKDHVDVITKYSHSEALTLMKQGEIPMDDNNGNSGYDAPEFDIVVVTSEGNDDDRKETNVKVTKDDSWFNSILPPTDSDDEGEANEGSVKDGRKSGTLNQKGLKLKNGIVQAPSSNSDKIELVDANGNEIEEIDLETL
jgi:bifunctional DNA-binding transcriptional regulator/antitoxin component of YhaV-PrlF toxin-antitoxin module